MMKRIAVPNCPEYSENHGEQTLPKPLVDHSRAECISQEGWYRRCETDLLLPSLMKRTALTEMKKRSDSFYRSRTSFILSLYSDSSELVSDQAARDPRIVRSVLM